MRIVIDACVLYPTVMREMVLGLAALGHFEPIWSERILEEWARAAVKLGPAGAAQARAEIAVLRATWPGAEKPRDTGLETRLWLPDDNDIHVLALAVSTSADAIMTLNKKDFPKSVLSEQGLDRLEPDGFLYALWQQDAAGVDKVASAVLKEARRLSGHDWQMRALLKKARLPRLAKALQG